MNCDYISDFNSLIASASSNEYDIEKIKSAFSFAEKAHENQLRQSGDPYIVHPLSVAKIIFGLGLDTDSIVASLLHDVVEDTPVELEQIKKLFGSDVALLVDGVTKLGKIPYSSQEEEQAENLRKMLMAMSEDIRVIVIKLADRLHNMRTIDAVPEQKRRDKSLETIEIYAPIAHRLGIRAVKEELEDLSIRHLDPIAYKEISEKLVEFQQNQNDFLQKVQQKIKDRLLRYMSDVHISSRVKTVYGIYRKMYLQGKSFDEIYDIYAVRVITDSDNDCYNVLGTIHDMYTPIPGRFKDYISTPKPNHYQSLHTTVLGHEGIPFEIQIRTWEMHKTAEYGIAAHWKYKNGINKSYKSDEHLAWIRKLLEAQMMAGEPNELVQNIKIDLDQENVFIMTPKGDVIILPVGATVIDFAYAIHSAVGNKMIGAKVDGRIVPIDYVVKNGDVVEIITTNQKDHGPSRDWLGIVKTGEARSKIRNWFKKERRSENIEEGKSSIEREMRRDLICFNDEKQKNEFIESIASIYHCNNVDDFFASIGYGGLLISRILPRMREEFNKNYRKQTVEAVKPVSDKKVISHNGGVIVDGIDDCLVKFSRCCNPLPGDEIVGFVTRGHGVSIHKKDCNNVPKDLTHCSEPERWIPVYWNAVQNNTFDANIIIVSQNNSKILADVTSLLANMHINIKSIIAKENKEKNYVVTLTISSLNKDHLLGIISRIYDLDGIIKVDRTVL